MPVPFNQALPSDDPASVVFMNMTLQFIFIVSGKRLDFKISKGGGSAASGYKFVSPTPTATVLTGENVILFTPGMLVVPKSPPANPQDRYYLAWFETLESGDLKIFHCPTEWEVKSAIDMTCYTNHCAIDSKTNVIVYCVNGYVVTEREMSLSLKSVLECKYPRQTDLYVRPVEKPITGTLKPKNYKIVRNKLSLDGVDLIDVSDPKSPSWVGTGKPLTFVPIQARVEVSIVFKMSGDITLIHNIHKTIYFLITTKVIDWRYGYDRSPKWYAM